MFTYLSKTNHTTLTVQLICVNNVKSTCTSPNIVKISQTVNDAEWKCSRGCIIALFEIWFTDAATKRFFCSVKITLGNSQPGNPHFGTGLVVKEIGRIQLNHSGVPGYSCLQATQLVTSIIWCATPEWRSRKISSMHR